MSDAPRLAVIVPTRGRPRILDVTLSRLALHAPDAPIEVLVVHDAGDDETRAVAERERSGARWAVRVLVQEGVGPARRRNRGIAAARAPVCLFIGDDVLCGPRLIEGHLDFHGRHPEPTEALLGRVVPAPPLDRYPFIRWLHEHGAQFNYAALQAGAAAGPEHFWTANISVKRDFLREAGGFDESFPKAAAEDIELGFRLAAKGMRLHYDPALVAHHFHPTDLRRTLVRMRDIGASFRPLCERVPQMPAPTRPGARHRAKAAALTLALAAGRSTPARHSAWTFLCDEALRESYWGAGSNGDAPRIGRVLARLALADPQANPPLPEQPASVG